MSLFPDIFLLSLIFLQFISFYYAVRNGEIYKRNEFLCKVAYMFEVAYVMILIVYLFHGGFMTDIDIFTLLAWEMPERKVEIDVSGENVCYVTCMMTWQM